MTAGRGRWRWRPAATVLVFALGGCALGPRPELRPPAAGSGDASVDAVLSALDGAQAVPFRATYRIVTAAGPTATAVVDQRDGVRRTVTIGDVRYETVDGATRTCDTTGSSCEPGADLARISDLAVTADFFGASAAGRLRADAGRRIGPTTPETATVAGQPATCVTIPVQVTAARYCALDVGPLASMATTDVTIELTEFSAG